MLTALSYHFLAANNCFSTYSSTNLTWESDLDPRCSSVPFSVVDVTAVVVGILFVMNLATFSKIYIFYKSKRLGDNAAEMRMRKNKIMFIQTILQDVIYLIDMFFTFSLRWAYWKSSQNIIFKWPNTRKILDFFLRKFCLGKCSFDWWVSAERKRRKDIVKIQNDNVDVQRENEVSERQVDGVAERERSEPEWSEGWARHDSFSDADKNTSNVRRTSLIPGFPW